MISRVFVAEPNSRYDLSALLPYGDVVYVFSPGEERRSMPVINDPPLAVEILRKGLKSKGFNPHQDFLCLTGSTLSVSYLLAAASAMFPVLKLLLFHAGTENYVTRVWNLQEQNHGEVTSAKSAAPTGATAKVSV